MNRPARSPVLTTLGELGLALLGTAAALWVLQRTGSVLLAAWCCFLVQALRVRFPDCRSTSKASEDARFERARFQAEVALARLDDHGGRRRCSRTNPLSIRD